jgi:TolA-binding protein
VAQQFSIVCALYFEVGMKHLSTRLSCFLALGLVLAVGCSKAPSADELLKSAVDHQKSEEFDAAVVDFEMLTQKYPKSDKVPEALFAIGSIYLNSKKEYVKAESVYTKLVMDFPEDPTAQGAAYQRARIFVEHLHKPDSALAAYELFLSRYPNSMQASSAKSELADLKRKPTPEK